MGQVGKGPEKTVWGQFADGSDVVCITLSNDDAALGILSFGATWQNFYLKGCESSLVLGYTDLAGYLEDRAAMGGTIGPIANRVSGAHIPARGAREPAVSAGWTLPANIPPHSLHSGALGFHRTNWRVADLSNDRCRFALSWRDPSGLFPAEIEVSATYRLKGTTVELEIEAVPDRECPLGLTNHAYFNLSGPSDPSGSRHMNVDDHHLSVEADNFTESDAEQLPTGAFKDIATLGLARGAMCALEGVSLDDNFCLASAMRDDPEPAAVLIGGQAQMRIATTEPGLQAYTSNGLGPTGPTIHGVSYGKRAGICLETQNWPDSANRPEFPDIWFSPDHPYRAVTRFEFAKTGSNAAE